MSKTIEHLVDQYGSVENYLREVGISDQEIAHLRERLCKPGQAPDESTSVQQQEENEFGNVSFKPRE